jgi:methionyl-tRNA formyltransferase
MLYNIEFQVQQLERKVAFASGKRSLEETLELNEQINALNKQLDSQKNENQLLNNQVRKLNDELRAAKSTKAEVLKMKEKAFDLLNVTQMETETEEREVKLKLKGKEELTVHCDEMKLEVKRYIYYSVF